MKIAFTLNGKSVSWELDPGQSLRDALRAKGDCAARAGCAGAGTGDSGVDGGPRRARGAEGFLPGRRSSLKLLASGCFTQFPSHHSRSR